MSASDGGLSVDTVLVPVDGSLESADAAEYAVEIADRYGADLHVLYVLDESVSHAIEVGDVSVDDAADESRAFIGDLRALAVDADVEFGVSMAYGFSTHRKIHHPGSVVLDCAEEVDADFLVIPRERDNAADVLEKVAEYVLLYASQPVLSV